MTLLELLEILSDPSSRETVQRALGLPTEPVARRLDELAVAQARTEASVKELAAEVRQLTVAQARTDSTVKELAAAQTRTDSTVKELAAAQTRTDAAVEELAQSMKEFAAAQAALRQEVGKLSDNVGFGLEELAPIVLPGWLSREEGVEVDRFARRFIVTEGGEEELDLYAEARKNGSELVVVGECKSRIYTGDVKKFAAKIQRVSPVLPAPALPVMFGFVVHPAASDAGRELGVRVVATRPSV